MTMASPLAAFVPYAVPISTHLCRSCSRRRPLCQKRCWYPARTMPPTKCRGWMALGPGVVQGVVIDSHFAERGRMGGLIGAVTQSPRVLGIGIDEDTAIIVEPEHCFRVIGSGAVYVVDGRAIKYSSLSEQNAESILNVHGVKIHVMGSSASFDLMTRTPTAPQCTDQN